MARTYKPKAGWESDPYVAIDPRQVRAAIKLTGFSVASAARTAGVSKQVLQHHVDGDEPRQCRASLRESLARTLRVPEQYLAGSDSLTSSLFLVWGREFNVNRLTALAASRILDRVLERCSDAGLSAHETTDVANAVALLLRPGEWHRRLFLSGMKANKQGRDRVEPDDAVTEQAVLALCQAVEQLLEPWLSQNATLNIAYLASLADLDGAKGREQYVSWGTREPSASWLAIQHLFEPDGAPHDRSTAGKGRRGRR